MEYTKGEWEVLEIMRPHSITVRAPGKMGSIIATVNDKANAHLISAAPDLHKALKHICDRLYGVAGNETEVSSKLYGLLKALYIEGYEALAKVDGK